MADDDVDNNKSSNADLFGGSSSDASSSSDEEDGGGGGGNNPTPTKADDDDGEGGGDGDRDDSPGGASASAAPAAAPPSGEQAGEAKAGGGRNDEGGNERAAEGKSDGANDEEDDADDGAPAAAAAAAADADNKDDGGGGNDNRALFGDDDSSSDSDSSGEGDAEFDDAGAAIVGRRAIEGRDDTAPLPSSEGRELNDKFEEGDGGQSGPGDDGEDTQPTPHQGRRERKPLPPKTLSVPDVERPFVATGAVTATGRKKRVTLHMTKLPKVLGINPAPFDRHTYDPLNEEEEYGTLMSNMIRWRYARDPTSVDGLARDDRGNLRRESNARVVRWSDGTSSIYIGEEMFDLEQMRGATKPGSASAVDGGGGEEKKTEGKDAVGDGGAKGWGYLYLSQRASQVPNAENSDDEVPLPDEDSPTVTVLECVGTIQSKVTARPLRHGKTHKDMVNKVKQENLNKRRKIAEYVTMVDPEKEKLDRIAMKNEVLKSEAGRASRNYRPGGGGGGRRRPAMNREYLESMEDESKYDSYSISKLKKKRFAENDADDEFLDYGDSDDEEEDDEWSKKKREGLWRQKNKKARGGKSLRESSEEEEAMFQEESGDEEEEAPAARSGGARKRAAFADDED